MQSGLLRLDAHELHDRSNQWSERSADLAVVAPPSPGLPFQPTTSAVGSAHTAVELAAAALTARIQATFVAVAAGAAGYVGSEATATADVAAVRSRMV